MRIEDPSIEPTAARLARRPVRSIGRSTRMDTSGRLRPTAGEDARSTPPASTLVFLPRVDKDRRASLCRLPNKPDHPSRPGHRLSVVDASDKRPLRTQAPATIGVNAPSPSQPHLRPEAADESVTFAGRRLERRPSEDFDTAAAVADQ